MDHTWTLNGIGTCGTLLSGCVRGATHRNKGLPCQDASMASIQHYKGYPYALLAVADGHGAAQYPRSDLGAQFAVQAIAETAARWVLFAVECIERQPDDWLPNVRNDFGVRFARSLRKAWERNVDEHLIGCPLADTQPGSDAAYRAYGTTVALALVFKDRVFAGAIGDSTIFLVTNDGGEVAAVDVLIGEKSEALGLTTDSLAASDAAYKWKHRSLPLREVRLLLAATDGFADSLAAPLRTLETMYRDTCTKGFSWFHDKLPSFLSRLTEQGVGDDIATVFYFPPEVGQSSAAPRHSPVDTEKGEQT